MILVAIVFIVYGTSGPLSSTGATWIYPSDSWQWTPPLRASDANDVLTNLLVYIPVGLALRFLARRRGRRPIVDFAVAASGAAGLSWATELLQQWIPGRTASLTDVSINFVGGMIGALLAPPALRVLRQIHARAYAAAQISRSRVLAAVALASLLIAMTIPWTPSRFAVDFSLARTASLADIERFAFFGVWAGFLARSLSSRSRSRLSGLAMPMLLVLSAAAGVEAVQSILSLHTASLRDFVFQALGGILGLTAGVAGRATALSRLRAAMSFAALAAAAWLLLADPPPLAIREPLIDWIPFRAEFSARFVVALADAARTTLLLGVLALLGFEWAARNAGAAIFLTLASGTAAFELTRAALSDHVASPTPLVLAAIAVWHAGRIWTSLRPGGAVLAPRIDSPRPDDRSSTLVATQPI